MADVTCSRKSVWLQCESGHQAKNDVLTNLHEIIKRQPNRLGANLRILPFHTLNILGFDTDGPRILDEQFYQRGK